MLVDIAVFSSIHAGFGDSTFNNTVHIHIHLICIVLDVRLVDGSYRRCRWKIERRDFAELFVRRLQPDRSSCLQLLSHRCRQP